MRNATRRASLAALAIMFGLSPYLEAETNGTIYQVKTAESRFTIEVGRAGLFKVFGHDHLIVVDRFTGEVDWNANAPAESRFILDVDAASLRVADDEVSEEDRGKIQSDMESKALALPANPHIRFESTRVEVQRVNGAAFQFKVKGTLSLRGVEKPFEIPLTLTMDGDRATAKGEVALQSDKWGVPQVSAVGGSVKTKSDLKLHFEIVAVRE